MQENKQNFNHLKVHTQYSICEGAIKIDDLKNICKEKKIKSIGLSDTSNLCGALEFSELISKSGTQPIIGTQINFKFNDEIGILLIGPGLYRATSAIMSSNLFGLILTNASFMPELSS